MSCSRPLRRLVFDLSTYATTVQYFMSEEWVGVDDGASFDFALNLTGVTGNFTAKPCIQLATARADAPDAPAAISAGSYTGSTGYTQFRESSAGGTGKLLARVGVAYALSSGTSLGAGRGTLDPSLKTCIRVLAPRSVLINPAATTSTDINYALLTDFLPAVGLSKVKVAFIVTDNVSDYLEYQLLLRTAVDPNAPNSWQTTESAWANPATANTSRNTGELSAPAGASISSNSLFQLALGFRKKSGAGGNPRATVLAIPAVLYA